MKSIKKWLRGISIVVLTFFIPGKSKALTSNKLTKIDERVTKIRNAIKNDLKDKSADEITVEFKNFTTNNDWINWSNWGNWNNWNNWVKWNDWNNWNNWRDFSNWQKFSNY